MCNNRDGSISVFTVLASWGLIMAKVFYVKTQSIHRTENILFVTSKL